MADNVNQLGNFVLRTKDRTSVHTVVSLFDVGGFTGAEAIVGDSGVQMPVEGAVAEDAPLADNPVRQGVRASAAVPSAMSTDGDVVTPWADKVGRQVVKKQCGTGTISTVADNASSVTILAANTARLGCTIVNDSSAALYLKCGATASTTSYTVRLIQHAYWECPFGYTGIIDGIWATDPNDGAARVTEFT